MRKKLGTHKLLRKYFEICKQQQVRPTTRNATIFISNKIDKEFKYPPFSGSYYKQLRLEFGFRKGKGRGPAKKNVHMMTSKLSQGTFSWDNFLLINTNSDAAKSYHTIEALKRAYQESQDEGKVVIAYLKIPTKKETKEVLSI